MREATSIIEDDLLSTVAEALTSMQCADSYNRGFTSLRDQFCPLITKEIRVKDDAEWYDYRVVSLHRERRRTERRWRRIGSDAACTLYGSARRVVVKQVYTCKTEYYHHQMSQCDGDQRRTFIFLNNLMGCTLNPMMPTSSSDDELASRFSAFSSEKITCIRSEIDAAVVNREFSVDFPLRFTRSLTFSHFRLVTEADVLRYMRETRKTYCSLDPINVSKLGEAHESAVPAVGPIINSSFDEGHFMASEKHGLIWPYLKKIGLDVNGLSNYRPVTNKTHLSKIIQRAMLDQLVPFLLPICIWKASFYRDCIMQSRLQRVVVDGHFNDYRDVVSGVPQGSVVDPLLFILYTHDMWFGLENMLVSYADDATLLARIPPPNKRSDVTESLNRDLSKISMV